MALASTLHLFQSMTDIGIRISFLLKSAIIDEAERRVVTKQTAQAVGTLTTSVVEEINEPVWI